MGNLDDPGALITELDSLKENFGKAINVDEMLSKAGLDPTKLETLSLDLKKAQENSIGKTVGALGQLASGDLSAVKDLIGEVPSLSLPGFDAKTITDGICTSVPNLDLDADGNIVKKGVPTKAPSEDAEKVEPAEQAESPIVPEKDSTPSDKIKDGQTIILNPDGEKAKEIEQKFTDDLKQLIPLLITVNERINEFYENRKKRFNLQGAIFNKKKKLEEAKQLRRRNFQIVRRNTRDMLYIELLEDTIEYDRDKAFFDNGLILKEPKKPEITYEEIHERTYFSNYPDTIAKIEALPNLVIKGEKQERVDFSKKS